MLKLSFAKPHDVVCVWLLLPSHPSFWGLVPPKLGLVLARASKIRYVFLKKSEKAPIMTPRMTSLMTYIPGLEPGTYMLIQAAYAIASCQCCLYATIKEPERGNHVNNGVKFKDSLKAKPNKKRDTKHKPPHLPLSRLE